MKKKSLLICLTGSIFLFSCYKDKEELLYPQPSADCSNTSVQKGAQFIAVEFIIQNNCTSWHSASGGRPPDLSTACKIVDKWDRIQVRCVQDKDMPTSGPLSTADQQSITDWVNAGHLYTN